MIRATGVIVGLPFKGLILALGGVITSVATLVKRASQFLAVNNVNSSPFLAISTAWLEGACKLLERNLLLLIMILWWLVAINGSECMSMQ